MLAYDASAVLDHPRLVLRDRSVLRIGLPSAHRVWGCVGWRATTMAVARRGEGAAAVDGMTMGQVRVSRGGQSRRYVAGSDKEREDDKSDPASSVAMVSVASSLHPSRLGTHHPWNVLNGIGAPRPALPPTDVPPGLPSTLPNASNLPAHTSCKVLATRTLVFIAIGNRGRDDRNRHGVYSSRFPLTPAPFGGTLRTLLTRTIYTLLLYLTGHLDRKEKGESGMSDAHPGIDVVSVQLLHYIVPSPNMYPSARRPRRVTRAADRPRGSQASRACAFCSAFEAK